MFFITWGAGIVSGLCAALGCGECWLAQQMHHVPWAGLAHHDTIFPLFLFLAGVSWPFSYAAQTERGRTSWQIHCKIIRRMAVLALLGFFSGLVGRVGTPWANFAGAAALQATCWLVLFCLYRKNVFLKV